MHKSTHLKDVFVLLRYFIISYIDACKSMQGNSAKILWLLAPEALHLFIMCVCRGILEQNLSVGT